VSDGRTSTSVVYGRLQAEGTSHGFLGERETFFSPCQPWRAKGLGAPHVSVKLPSPASVKRHAAASSTIGTASDMVVNTSLDSGAAIAGFSPRRPHPKVQVIRPTTGKSPPAAQNLSSPRAKNISLFPKPKSVVMFAPSRSHKRGASRSSRTLEAGCGGRFGDARRAVLEADGETVWSWRPDAGAKFLRSKLLRDDGGAKEPGPRGDHV